MQLSGMPLARLLITSGVVLILLGVAVVFIGKFNLPLGRLPGDVIWRGRNSTFYFPVVTCLLLSVLGSLLLWFMNRRP